MTYTTDKQTDFDLNLSGRFKSSSMFNLFEQTATRGGSLLLEKIFAAPLTSAAEIIARRDTFIALQNFEGEFAIANEQMRQVEDYLNSSDYANIALSTAVMCWKKVHSIFAASLDYQQIKDGIVATHAFLNNVEQFLNNLKPVVANSPFASNINEGLQLLAEPQLSKFRTQTVNGTNIFSVAQNNHLLRKIYGKQLRDLLHLLEEVDCYLTVAREGKRRGFCYAEVRDSEETYISFENVRHPRVPGAVGNSFKLTHDSNVIFLTGANMAGKSTFMKAFGIALYLAHLGFPVPADKMEFTPMEGMFTSINVPDDISQGYSHFYAEVMRVKNIAKEVASGKRLMVIFDE
ncbi:MAG: hypothetical protein LBU91_07740, partial [Bacteroidales bacterium]|nr:hypothetical protein [Bacteroidales bacterium]